MIAGGVEVGLPFPLLGGLAMGLVFFSVPDLTLRSQAEGRRRDFRHALGSFLDLVVIGLAGGAGVESALADAASIGRGGGSRHRATPHALPRPPARRPRAARART